MSRTVELIYETGCPNVGAARKALLQAFALTGADPVWSEWERGDPGSPDYVQAFGSPAILVNGRDVAPPVHPEGGCCRLYWESSGDLSSAPPAAVIAAALGTNSSGGRKWPGLMSLLGAAAVAIHPTCPFCWPLYAAVLGAVGLGFLFQREYLLPLAGALLIITLAPPAKRALERNGSKPLLLGTLGSLFVGLGKFVWTSDLLLYTGLAFVAAASIWNLRFPHSGRGCPRCK